jgi:hypothetical protein
MAANQDIYAVLAQANSLRLQQASNESGAYDNPTLGARVLSLSEASAPANSQEVARALATPQSPADPRWARRLPPPPCESCGMDHRGNRVYDHQYVHPRDLEEAQRLVDQYGNQIQQTQGTSPTPIRAGVERKIVNRVAIYDSRSGYVVKVESPPEWDDVPGSKTPMDRDEIKMLLRVLRGLGVRVKNNSEDEFEEEEKGRDISRDPELREPAQGEPARAAGGAHRSAEDAQREWQELLPGTTPPSLEPAHSDGATRADTDRQPTRTARSARTRKAG